MATRDNGEMVAPAVTLPACCVFILPSDDALLVFIACADAGPGGKPKLWVDVRATLPALGLVGSAASLMVEGIHDVALLVGHGERRRALH